MECACHTSTSCACYDPPRLVRLRERSFSAAPCWKTDAGRARAIECEGGGDHLRGSSRVRLHGRVTPPRKRTRACRCTFLRRCRSYVFARVVARGLRVGRCHDTCGMDVESSPPTKPAKVGRVVSSRSPLVLSTTIPFHPNASGSCDSTVLCCFTVLPFVGHVGLLFDGWCGWNEWSYDGKETQTHPLRWKKNKKHSLPHIQEKNRTAPRQVRHTHTHHMQERDTDENPMQSMC